MDAGEMTDLVLKRVHAEGELAHTKVFARNIVSLCQQAYNTYARVVVKSSSVVLTPRKMFYKISDILPDAIDILAVKQNNEAVARCKDWKQFVAMYGADWFRSLGDGVRSWARVGREYVLFFPANASEGATVEVVYSKLCDKLETDMDALEVSIQDEPGVMALSEMVLLMRDREMLNAQMKVGDLAAALHPTGNIFGTKEEAKKAK